MNPLREYALRHLPDHLRSASRWETLHTVLSDCDFLESKLLETSVVESVVDDETRSIEYHGIYDLLDNLYVSSAALAENGRLAEASSLSVLLAALRRHSHRLLTYPQTVCQLVGNDLASTQETTLVSSLSHSSRPYLQRLNRPLQSAEFGTIPLRNPLVGIDADRSPDVLLALDSEGLLYALNLETTAATQMMRLGVGGYLASLPPSRTFIHIVEDCLELRRMESGAVEHQFVATVDNQSRSTRRLAVSPSLDYLAIGSTKDPQYGTGSKHGSGAGRLEIRSLFNNSLLFVFENRKAVTALAFSPDSRFLAVAFESEIVMFSIRPLAVVGRLLGHEAVIWTIAFSLDGTQIATGSGNDETLGEVLHWNLGHLSQRQDQIKPSWKVGGWGKEALNGHSKQVQWVTCLAYSPTGTLVAVVGQRQVPFLLDTTTGRVAAELIGDAQRNDLAAFNSDGSILATGSTQESIVKLWDIRSAQSLGTKHVHQDWIRDVDIDPVKSIAVSVSYDELLVYSSDNQEQFHIQMNDAGSCETVALRPNKYQAATGGYGGNISVFHFPTKKLLARLTFPDAHIECLRFTPDGSYLLCLASQPANSQTGILTAYHSENYTLAWQIRGVEGQSSVAVSADSRHVAVLSARHVICLVNISTGSVFVTLCEADRRSTFSISADGGTLLMLHSGTLLLVDLSFGHRKWEHSIDDIRTDGRTDPRAGGHPDGNVALDQSCRLLAWSTGNQVTVCDIVTRATARYWCRSKVGRILFSDDGTLWICDLGGYLKLHEIHHCKVLRMPSTVSTI